MPWGAGMITQVPSVYNSFFDADESEMHISAMLG